MSGGIDSTVAAMLLHEQGYDLVGITMKTWDYASSGGSKKETGCCSLDSINDARAVAVDLGFPHYIIDIRDEFGESVIDYFVNEYIAGRTPNPCVMCNTHIKWNALLKRADALGCRYIATGHYAQTRLLPSGRWVIGCGNDRHKDQSYVLWGLSQENLSRNLFPVGKYEKSQIRQMAADRGYTDLAKKAESYEICFVPDNDYRSFLKRRIPDLQERVAGGNFVNSAGEIIGKHEGYPFYTIGQRKLGQAFGKTMYVKEIVAHTNTVVLGELHEIERNGMWVGQANYIKYADLGQGMEAIVKIRYKDPGTPALIRQEGDKIRVEFFDKVNAITPGQSAVFYEGDDVIGGGIIEGSFEI